MRISSIKIIILLAGLCLFFSTDALAYKIERYEERVEDRFVVSPAKIDLLIKPGEIREEEFVVINRLGRKEDFFLQIEDFIGSQDDREAIIFLGSQSAGPTSARNWIEPDIRSFSLEAGERITIKLKISPPLEAHSGGHYAAVFAATKSRASEGKEGQVDLVSRAGVLALLTVEGDIEKKGTIESFSSDRKFYRNGPVKMEIIFQNAGDVHLRSKGEIGIFNLFGLKVGTIPLEEIIVFPDSKRKQRVSWEKKWILGYYRAEISLEGEDARFFNGQKETKFLAFPWHVFLLGLMILILILWLLRRFLGKFELRRVEEQPEEQESNEGSFRTPD